MTILFAGGEMGAVVPSDSNVNESTSALGGAGDSYDSNFARGYLRHTSSVSYSIAALAAAEDDLWVHFEFDQRNASQSATLRTVCEWLDGSDVAKFRLQTAASSDLWMLHYHNGSTWVDLGTQFTADGDSLQTIDIHFVCNTASGSVNMYLSGTNRLNSGTVDLSSITGIKKMKMYGNTISIDGQNAFSQIIMATGETTIGKRLMTFYASGVGASDSWTNNYTAIDELVYSDADFIFAESADLVELFAGTTVGSMTGYTVRAVAVTARANTDGTGPANLQLAVRTGSTNYFSSSQALDVAMGAYYAIWETNPNTTIDWTATDISTLQFGVKSIT